VLIVSGMLVGASGTFLTLMMARAMGRSVTNVLFGAFGTLQVSAEAIAARDSTVRPTTAEDVAVILAYSPHVVILPGYGLAAARRPHPAGEPDLRDADPRRRPREAGRRAQAEHDPGLRRNRHPALRRAADGDAVRGREGLRGQAERRPQSGLMRLGLVALAA